MKEAVRFFDWEGVIAKEAFITKTWTKAMEDFHREMGYNVRRELGNIDLTVFDERHSEAQIAIELQHDKTQAIKRDVPKLACSNAGLKVLLTRVLESDIKEYKKTIMNFWRRRSKRAQNDELLLLLLVHRSIEGERAMGFLRIEACISKNSRSWEGLETIYFKEA